MKSKAYLFVLSFIFFLPALSNAQLLKKAQKSLGLSSPGSSESEAVQGIKEALVKGTGESVNFVSVVDGYFGNPEIKIPFPEDAKMVENKLRAMGLGKKV